MFQNGFKPTILNNFTSKADIVDACLCSCHIPLFMVPYSLAQRVAYSLNRLFLTQDTKLYNKYQGKRYLDGSFYPFVQSLVKRYSLEKDISQFNMNNVAVMDWYSLTHTRLLTCLLAYLLTHSYALTNLLTYSLTRSLTN